MCGWSLRARVCEGRLGFAVFADAQSAGTRAGPDGKRAWNEARAVEMWRPTGGLCLSGAGVWRGIPAGGGTGTSRVWYRLWKRSCSFKIWFVNSLLVVENAASKSRSRVATCVAALTEPPYVHCHCVSSPTVTMRSGYNIKYNQQCKIKDPRSSFLLETILVSRFINRDSYS